MTNKDNQLTEMELTQKLIFEAYKLQNEEIYDQALYKLQAASENLIKKIQTMQKSSQFYMKVMPIMKQERQLISEKDYKDFWGKNEKMLCRNFQKNAYRALIMQQLREKQIGENERLQNDKVMDLQELSCDKEQKTLEKRHQKKKILKNKKKPKPTE